VLQVAFATAGFAVVHSALAATSVKDAVAARFRNGRELYRVAYNAHAVAAFGVLVWYVARRPKRTIYRVRGAPAGVMRLGQLGGIGFAVAAARATGVAKLAGVDNAVAVAAGMRTREVPAAQGPEADESGALRIHGPFRIVRHPLNLAPLAPFWLTPHMTSRRLAFNLVATAYLVLGSIHEEKRLLRRYGAAYAAYQRGGVPFYVPAIGGRSRRCTPDAATRASDAVAQVAEGNVPSVAMQ
jgi:protein-S-isoprenylcysteine O-methyltransferase Ste14